MDPVVQFNHLPQYKLENTYTSTIKIKKKHHSATIGYFFSKGEALRNHTRKADMTSFCLRHLDHEKISDPIHITTADKHVLEGRIINPTDGKTNIYLIRLNGFTESYESHLNRAVDYANKINAKIVLFNYRGTTEETVGSLTCTHDLVEDTLSIIEFLKDKKDLTPGNLILHGFSLGGGIAAKTVQPGKKNKISQEMQQILNSTSLILDRTYIKFSSIAKDVIKKHLNNEKKLFAIDTIGSIIGEQSIKNLGFEINTKKVFKESQKNKSKLEERTLVIYHECDNVIDKNYSLHSLKKEAISTRKFIDLNEYHLKMLVTHNPKFLYEETLKFSTNIETYENIIRILENNKYDIKLPELIYREYLIKQLSKMIRDNELVLKYGDSRFEAKNNIETQKEIFEIESLCDKLCLSPHNLPFLQFKEVVDQINEFIHRNEKQIAAKATKIPSLEE